MKKTVNEISTGLKLARPLIAMINCHQNSISDLIPGSNLDLIFWSFLLAKKQKHKSASKKTNKLYKKKKVLLHYLGNHNSSVQYERLKKVACI